MPSPELPEGAVEAYGPLAALAGSVPWLAPDDPDWPAADFKLFEDLD